MSGMDEQRPVRVYKCPDCGGSEYYRVDYGAITSRIELDPNVIQPYTKGHFMGNDSEDWRCYDCYSSVDDETKEHISEIIEREESQ